ncbi:MAG: MFS transporter, partial [Chloroflexota bacterium]
MKKSTLRTFYVVAATQGLSILGTSMSSFALAIWIFTETGNTTPILLVGVMSMLPRMFLNSVAGVFADRLNRKMLIIFSDAMQALPTLFLAMMFMTGQFQIWMLYGATFIQALFGMVQGPAIFASVTMLVPDAHRDRANAVLESISPAAGVAAPVIGGLLYAIVGVAGVLIIDVVSFIIAVAIIATLHIPQPQKSEASSPSEGSVWREVKGGALFLWASKPLLLLSAYFLLVNFLQAGVWPLMTPFILTRVDYNESLLGLISGITSVGLFVGGLIPIVYRGTQQRIHTIMPIMIFATIALLIFVLVQDLLIMSIIGFLMMLPYKWSNVLILSICQSKIPPDMQGRIFALTSQIAMFAMPLALIISGPLIDNVLIPFTAQPTWDAFAPYFGTGEGGAMALFISVSAMLLFVVSVA